MKKPAIKSMIERYNKGTLSEAEKAMLESWYINEIKSNNDYRGLEENLSRLDEEFLPMIAEKPSIRLWPKIAVAASFLMAIGLGWHFYASRTTDITASALAHAKDINPAGHRAYLTLGNGKRIALDDSGKGVVATQNQVRITKTADGQLVYTVSGDDPSPTLTYNTIETPKSGRYEVVLPDGTHVWMNAASSLKYPTSFASLRERKVELLGEAYFEVAKDKHHPFIVKTNLQEVEVLGTHFNISSYMDEPSTKTTLLEGSVKVTLTAEKRSETLVPGQQAVLNAKEIEIGNANLDQAVSWKNGEFNFAGEDLKTVMREVARWYDVEVEYQGNVNTTGVVSIISRTKKLSQLLKALQINQGIHFKIEGRRVIVMP